MKYLEVYNLLHAWISSEVHQRLKDIDEEQIDSMPQSQLKQLEGIKIPEFVVKFNEEIKP